MAAATTYTDAAQERILNGVRRSHQTFTDVVAAWAKAVEKAVPSVHALPVAQPEKLVNGTFDFVQQLLDAQRDFAKDVLSAAEPVLEKVERKPVSGKRAKVVTAV
jgi:hypothetical protein